jgi:hypothetical protein
VGVPPLTFQRHDENGPWLHSFDSLGCACPLGLSPDRSFSKKGRTGPVLPRRLGHRLYTRRGDYVDVFSTYRGQCFWARLRVGPDKLVDNLGCGQAVATTSLTRRNRLFGTQGASRRSVGGARQATSRRPAGPGSSSYGSRRRLRSCAQVAILDRGRPPNPSRRVAFWKRLPA